MGIRVIHPEEIDRRNTWGFFDGASESHLVKCGGGAVLHLSDDHFFLFSIILGAGTNNYAKLLSVKHLFLFSLEKGYSRIQIFGDSMIILN